MRQQGCLPVETCRTLASDPLPHNSALTRRQPKDRQERLRRTGSSDWSFGSAPSRGFLAVDLITIKHEGEGGVGRHYSSSTRGVCWGHTFTSSVLQDPYQGPAGSVATRSQADQWPPESTRSSPPARRSPTSLGAMAGYELYGSTGPTKPQSSGFLVAKFWFIVACFSLSSVSGLGKCDGDRVGRDRGLRKGVQDSELATCSTSGYGEVQRCRWKHVSWQMRFAAVSGLPRRA